MPPVTASRWPFREVRPGAAAPTADAIEAAVTVLPGEATAQRIVRALFLAMLAGVWMGSTATWLYLRTVCP